MVLYTSHKKGFPTEIGVEYNCSENQLIRILNMRFWGYQQLAFIYYFFSFEGGSLLALRAGNRLVMGRSAPSCE